MLSCVWCFPNKCSSKAYDSRNKWNNGDSLPSRTVVLTLNIVMLDNYCRIQSYEVAAIIIYEFLIHQLTVNDLLYFSDFWAELKKLKI